jgi:hypothetical protein
MCHHIETADHERVMELAEEWKEWKQETAADADADDPVAAPADD